jgi:ubiquinone biosynthesis protein UbiJ
MLLTQDEITELTGSKRLRTQIFVLSENQIGFIVRYDGKLSTTWDAVNSALIKSEKEKEQTPRLDFLS